MITFEAGEMMVATGTRDLRFLTKGKQYKCLYGTEEGIFLTRPYVTVINDNGEEYSCHQSRFEKVEK